MNDYFSESDKSRRDAIAAAPREKKLGLSDVKAMFLEMKRLA
jgi:hypothetical protein